MQINQTTVNHSAQMHSSQVHLSQAVAGNRPIESASIKEINPKQEVNSLASSKSVQQTQSTQSSANPIENSLSQREREQAVVDSGVFQSDTSQDLPIALKQQAKVEYDAESKQSRGAISAYMMTMHAAKRDEIQQMVGIDLYA